jgi:hypothetical protein
VYYIVHTCQEWGSVEVVVQREIWFALDPTSSSRASASHEPREIAALSAIGGTESLPVTCIAAPRRIVRERGGGRTVGGYPLVVEDYGRRLRGADSVYSSTCMDEGLAGWYLTHRSESTTVTWCLPGYGLETERFLNQYS